MKTTLFFLFLPMVLFVNAQDDPKLTPLETKYSENNTPTVINGRVNRNVKTKTTNTYVVDYNFEDGVFERNLLRVKVNTPVVFKISNINRLAYDIKVTGKDSTLSMSFAIPDVDKGATQIKTIESNTYEKGLEQILKLVEESTKNIIRGSDTENKVANLSVLFKEIETKVNQIAAIESNLKALTNKKTATELELSKTPNASNLKNDSLKINLYENNASKMQGTLGNMSITIQNLNHKKDSLYKSLEDTNKKVKVIDNTLSEYKRKEEAFLINYLTFINSRHTTLRLLRKHQQTCLLAINDPFLTYDKFVDFQKDNDLNTVKVELMSLVKDIESLDSIFQQARENYIIAKNVHMDGDFEKEKNLNQKTVLDARFTYLETQKKETDQLDAETIIFSLLQSLKFLEDEKNYGVESYPVLPLQDLVYFDVSISHKSKETKIDNSRKFNHQEYTYGGVRLDAGLGFAVTYLSNTPKYDLISNGSNDFTIAVDKKHYYSSSLIALFSATVRTSRHVAWGGSAGIGVTIGDESTLEFNNYYIGGTAMFGKNNRFAITTGISLKEVDILRVGYDLGSSISSDDIDFTSEKIRFGPFFSITYNLTKGLRDNIKQMKSFVSF